MNSVILAVSFAFAACLASYPARAQAPNLLMVSTLPGVVSLFSPSNNVNLTERRPTLSWFTATAPDSTWFHIYLQRDGSKYLEQWVHKIHFDAVLPGYDIQEWIPASDLPYGTYTWWVQGWNSYGTGPWSRGSTFSIDSNLPQILNPILPQPGSTVSNSTVCYSWTADTNATWYELQIVKGLHTYQSKWFAATSSLADLSLGQFVVDVPGHSHGTYSFSVRGWNPDGLGPWSIVSPFNVAALKLGHLTLLSPTITQSNTSVVRYTWAHEPKACWYEMCLVKNGRTIFDQWCAATDSAIDTSSGQFAMDLAGHGGGAYSWWVRGWNPDGFGPWSGTNYQVPVQIPAATTVLSPTGIVSAYQPALQWEAVEGATWYNLWIRKDGSKYYSTWLNTNSWTPPWDLPIGVYDFWVQTWNEDGLGPWSAPMSFTIFFPPTGVITIMRDPTSFTNVVTHHQKLPAP